MTVEMPDSVTEAPEDVEPEPSRIERLSAEKRPRELLLWLDLETAPTGWPSAKDDTVLEAAWMVTYREAPVGLVDRRDWTGHGLDLSDWQLTPLRSRLCAIGPPDGAALTPDECERWSGSGVHRKVTEMHDASGLTDEHIAAQLAGRVIEHPAVLEQLVLDDIIAAQSIGRAEAQQGDDDLHLYIAGSGVGHYDQPLLSRGHTDSRGRYRGQFERLARRWYYRPEDVSHAVHAFGSVRHPVELVLASRTAVRVGEVLAEGLIVDPRIDIAGGVNQAVLTEWMAAEEIAHRAAADVVRAAVALLAARDMVGNALTRTY